MIFQLNCHPSSGGGEGGGEGGVGVGSKWGDLLAVRLLSMVTRFCSGSAPHFPMKKVGLEGCVISSLLN